MVNLNSSKAEREHLCGLLGYGRDEARSSYDLASELGIGQRKVGFMVNKLRAEGHLIGSLHGQGYFMIRTWDEYVDTMAHIEKRKQGIDKTLSSLRGAWYAAHRDRPYAYPIISDGAEGA